MFLYWRCGACGLRRHASVSEIAYDQQGRLKTWMCPCKGGVLKMFKSATMPDIPDSGYQSKDPLADIPDGDADAPAPRAPLTVPTGGREEVPQDPVQAALKAGDGNAPEPKPTGPGIRPIEGDKADDEIAKAWAEHAGQK